MTDRISNALAGEWIAITGRLSMKRDRCIGYIERHGGRFVTAVTTQTDVLVVGDTAQHGDTKKITDARNAGVKIVIWRDIQRRVTSYRDAAKKEAVHAAESVKEFVDIDEHEDSRTAHEKAWETRRTKKKGKNPRFSEGPPLVETLNDQLDTKQKAELTKALEGTDDALFDL